MRRFLFSIFYLFFICFWNVQVGYSQTQALSKIEEIFTAYTSNYQLTESQKKELKKLISKKVEAQRAIEDSLSFNEELATYNGELKELQGHLAYMQLLVSYNLKTPIASQHNKKGNLIAENAKKGFVALGKTQQLLQTLLERKIALVEEQVAFYKWNNDHIIYNHDTQYNAKKIKDKFRKKIHEALTKDEYEAIFKPSLQALIDRRVTTNWEALKKGKTFSSAKQKKILKNLVSFYTKEEVIAWTYYKYDPNKSWSEISKIQKEARQKYATVLKELGVIKEAQEKDVIDPRYQHFRTQATNANLPAFKIEQLIALIDRTNTLVKQQKADFLAFQKKYLVYFHDKNASEVELYKNMKKEMAKLISIEEFQKIFQQQLQPRINRETNKQLASVESAYAPTPEQRSKIKKIIEERVTNEIMIREYYGYNHNYAMQKLRGQQYRFEKKYKSALLELGLVKRI